MAGAVAGPSPAKVGVELAGRFLFALNANVDADFATAVRGMLAEATDYGDSLGSRDVHGIGLRAMAGIRYWARTQRQGLYGRFAIGVEYQRAWFRAVETQPLDPSNPPPGQDRVWTARGLVFEPALGYRFDRARWQLGAEVSFCMPTDKDPYPNSVATRWDPLTDLHVSLIVAHRL